MILNGAAMAVVLLADGPAAADPMRWAVEWPHTDFSKSSVDFKEILSGGPPKDGIPSIDDPKFAPTADEKQVADREPVIG